MSEINATQLNEDIESIPGICADGKNAIRKIFKNHFGVQFKEPLKLGAIYSMYENGNRASRPKVCVVVKVTEMIELRNYHETYLFASLEGDYWTYGLYKNLEEMNNDLWKITYLASSPEEYFKKK